MNLMVGIVGAFVGGFLVSSILGFHYTEGFNLVNCCCDGGAIILLAVFGGFQNRRP